MKQVTTLCITGPDGAGKSTLIESVKKKLHDSITFSIWDLLHAEFSRPLIPFKDAMDIDSYLCRLHHESRSLFLMHCLWEAMQLCLEQNPSFIISDGYWFKYYATEVAHGTNQGYLDKIVSGFQQLDLVFYLDASESITAGRKNKYSRYECGFSQTPDTVSFKAFQHIAIAHLQQLMRTVNHIPLDPSSSIEDQTRFIINTLHERSN